MDQVNIVYPDGQVAHYQQKGPYWELTIGSRREPTANSSIWSVLKFVFEEALSMIFFWRR